MIVVYDELYVRHLQGIAHPESPDRVARVAAQLARANLLAELAPARDATDAELERVHPHVYLDMGGDTELICPYCSTLYRLEPTLSPRQARPPECALSDLETA